MAEICANPECGKPFKRRSGNQKYCCEKCRTRVRYLHATGWPEGRGMQSCRNPECGKQFKRQGYKQKYCCIKCGSRSRYLDRKSSPRRAEICANPECGKPFKPLRRNTQKYCCTKCGGWRRKQYLNTPEGKAGTLSRSANVRASEKVDRHDVLLMIWAGEPCPICGGTIELEDMSLDHVVPLAEGGRNCISNLVLTHIWCNLFKQDMSMEEAKAKYERIYGKLRKKKRWYSMSFERETLRRRKRKGDLQ